MNTCFFHGIVILYNRIIVIRYLMGNCAKPKEIKNKDCTKMPLKDKANNNKKSGQLYKFKKELRDEENKKPIQCGELSSSKAPHKQNSYSNPPSQKKISFKNLSTKESPTKNYKCKATQPQKSTNSQQNNRLYSKLNSKLSPQMLNYKLNKQDIQNCYQKGISLGQLTCDNNDQQELPRPQAKIIKKLNRSQPNQKQQNAMTMIQRQNKQNNQLTTIQKESPFQANNITQAVVPSINNILQHEQVFEGMFVQGQQQSRVQLGVSTSNIQFFLPKVRAGPLIVSQIDYSSYQI